MRSFSLIFSLLLFSSIGVCQKWQFAKSVGSYLSDQINCISQDKDQNLYIAGTFQEYGEIGDSVFNNYSENPYFVDIFLAKYNPKGNFEWAIQLGNETNNTVHSICNDNLGNK